MTSSKVSIDTYVLFHTEINGGLGLCEPREMSGQDGDDISSNGDSNTVSGHESDTSSSGLGSDSMDANASASLFHIVPAVKKLKLSCQFVDAVARATLNNSGLSDEVLLRLRDPPQHLLKIDDPSELYSLKQYLASQGASHKTYTAFRENHNDAFPDIPMLTYEQIDKRVGEWSGIHPIVHHMCPNSCITYTGPLVDLETCPKCKHSR